jgi:ankyrin repeat protein
LLDVDATTRQHIEHFKLEAVSALLAAHRPAASTRDAFGRTPLHLACMDIASCGEPAAFMLVDQCPQAAMIQDVEGRTPMHYLVGRNDSIPCSLLSKLITASPKALQTQDIVSETPLEIVKNRGKEIENVEEVTATLQSIEFSLPPSKARAESVSSEAFHGAEKPSQAAIRSTTI